ncbi:hypothetical protein ACFWNR_39110 [Streptomyces virginiae]|uniref:hypothetical protein n=1 Tax=Streptomyces virginiae TaxID=1961 RepID=UPI00364D0EB1
MVQRSRHGTHIARSELPRLERTQPFEATCPLGAGGHADEHHGTPRGAQRGRVDEPDG